MRFTHDWQAIWSLFSLTVRRRPVVYLSPDTGALITHLATRRESLKKKKKQTGRSLQRISRWSIFRFYFTQIFNYTSANKKRHRAIVRAVTRAAPVARLVRGAGWATAHARQTPEIVCLALGGSCLSWKARCRILFHRRCGVFCFLAAQHKTQTHMAFELKRQNFQETRAPVSRLNEYKQTADRTGAEGGKN